MQLEEREQARLIGAYIRRGEALGEASDDSPGSHRNVKLFVVNASPLPIRNLIGFLVSTADGSLVRAYPAEPVVLGKLDENGVSHDTEMAVPIDGPELVVVIEFHDDAGRWWRKYESLEEPLVRAENRPRPWG